MMYELNVSRNFKLSTDRLAMSGDTFFREGGGSHKSHVIRLSAKVGMGLPKSTSL